LEARLSPLDESPSDVAELPRMAQRAVLEDAFARLEREIEPGKRCIPLLELVDDAKGLQVVLEPAVFAHAIVELVLTGVAEGRVPEIVREADRLDEILVEPHRARDSARDLRDLERVGQSRTVVIPLVIDEDLRLVDETPKRRRMDDAVAVALELVAVLGRPLRIPPAARCGVVRGIRRERGRGSRSPRTHAVSRPSAPRRTKGSARRSTRY